MGKVYITGDTHIPYDFQKLKDFAAAHKELTKDDCVIVAGDFGLLWRWTPGLSMEGNEWDTKWGSEEILYANILDEFPFTTLFVDGNHENFDRLNSYPVSEWHGGKVHKITDSIIHLMRGQIFDLNGIRVFTFGGAASTDRGPATGTEELDEGICWWREELPSLAEREEAIDNLAKADLKVDIVVTHCLPDDLAFRLGYRDFNAATNFLWNVEEGLDFKLWFCGHYHTDEWVSRKARVLYKDIIDVAEYLEIGDDIEKE